MYLRPLKFLYSTQFVDAIVSVFMLCFTGTLRKASHPTKGSKKNMAIGHGVRKCLLREQLMFLILI